MPQTRGCDEKAGQDDEGDQGGDRPSSGDPGEALPPRCHGRRLRERLRDRALVRRQRLRGSRLGATAQPRPEDRPAEDGEERRNERDRHGEPDQGRQRHARPEGTEELELADEQRGAAAHDDEACGDHDRQYLDRGVAHCLLPRLPGLEASTHAREEEDRVVGDDPEQEHHHQRLDFLRYPDAGHIADPGDHVNRDAVGDRGGEEGEERGADRSEGEGQQDGDQDDAGELDVRERGVDLVELRQARGYRSGDPDECVVGTTGQSKVPGALGLIPQPDVRVEEEPRDRGRRAPLSRRETPAGR